MIRVVIADDHCAFIESFTVVLSTHKSIEVVGTAFSGREAIDICQNALPDVVLLDIDMPGGSGFDVCPQILALTPTPHVLIFSCTTIPVSFSRPSLSVWGTS